MEVKGAAVFGILVIALVMRQLALGKIQNSDTREAAEAIQCSVLAALAVAILWWGDLS